MVKKTATKRQFEVGQVLTVQRICRGFFGSLQKKKIKGLRFTYLGKPVETPLLELVGHDGWFMLGCNVNGVETLGRAVTIEHRQGTRVRRKPLAYALQPEGHTP